VVEEEKKEIIETSLGQIWVRDCQDGKPRAGSTEGSCRRIGNDSARWQCTLAPWTKGLVCAGGQP